MRWAEQLRRADALDAELSATLDDAAQRSLHLRALLGAPTTTVGAGVVIGFACAQTSPRRALALLRLGWRSLRIVLRLLPAE
jgi:hypothetical protein